MRKLPPPGNVRRTRSLGTNIRSECISGKDESVIQVESFLERILALIFDRDPTVKRYRSQPIFIPYKDAKGVQRNYPPDFEVERIDGSIEIHEVALSKRREKESAKLREEAAIRYCQEQGWKYCAHTEQTLPNPTEATNLYSLYGYSARCFCEDEIRGILLRDLEIGKKWRITDIAEQLAKNLGISRGYVVATICWMVWHSELEINMSTLIFVSGEPNRESSIWRKKGAQNEPQKN